MDFWRLTLDWRPIWRPPSAAMAAEACFRDPRWRPLWSRWRLARPPPLFNDPRDAPPALRDPRLPPPFKDPRCMDARPPGAPWSDPRPGPSRSDRRPAAVMDPRPCSFWGAGGANFWFERASAGISSMRLKGRRRALRRSPSRESHDASSLPSRGRAPERNVSSSSPYSQSRTTVRCRSGNSTTMDGAERFSRLRKATTVCTASKSACSWPAPQQFSRRSVWSGLGATVRPTGGALAQAAMMSRAPAVPNRFQPSFSVARWRPAATAPAHAAADGAPRRFRDRSRSRSVWFVRRARATPMPAASPSAL